MAKLLLVEDDNNLREIYEARLQAEGYTIVSAKDGEEALVVAKAEKPDLVISDVMMPKISGFEMLDIMRNTDELKGVKVIMLTALGQSDDQQRADKLGADRYLVKSQVTLEDIVKVTHELLEGDAAPAIAGAQLPADAAPKAEAPAPAPTPEPAPAVVAEPVAVEPTPAPAPAETPAPAPEPAPEPAVQPAPDATASNDAAEPAAKEEADVEAKIEDFVAGATSEATLPVVVKSSDADDDDKEEEKTDEEKAESLVSDDKLMADAVEKLVSSTDDDKEDEKDKPAGDDAPSAPTTPPETEEKPAETVVAPTVIPISVAPDDTAARTPIEPTPAPSPVKTLVETPPETPAAEPETPKPEEPAEEAPEKIQSDSGSGSVNHAKIIKPLESAEVKKDIKQLLADEEAKEAQTVPGNTVVAGVQDSDSEDKPSGGPSAPPSAAAPVSPSAAAHEGVDPNSIAL